MHPAGDDEVRAATAAVEAAVEHLLRVTGAVVSPHAMLTNWTLSGQVEDVAEVGGSQFFSCDSPNLSEVSRRGLLTLASERRLNDEAG